MAWVCTSASGTDSLIFINDETHDGEIHTANLQRNTSNLTERYVIIPQDHERKIHWKHKMGKKMEGFRLTRSVTYSQCMHPMLM